MITMEPTTFRAEGNDERKWTVLVQHVGGDLPWYWSAWIASGNGGIEWDGFSPTREAAEQNAVGSLDALQWLLRSKT